MPPDDPSDSSLTLLSRQRALALMNWLARHPESVTPAALSPHLDTLLEISLPPHQKLYALEHLFARLERCLEAQIAQFVDIGIPLDKPTYRQANALLDALGDFALAYESILGVLPAYAPEDEIGLCLERAIFCLYKHLLVNYLVGRPASLGSWQRLHAAYLRSRQSTLAFQSSYAEALLLAIAQPASLTSRELASVADYVRQLAGALSITENAPENPKGVFWIPAQQDFHAFPLTRRLPPPGARVFYFSCRAIVAQAKTHLESLAQATPPFPLADNLRDCRRLLERLLTCWGNPLQRRFPRHRKSYRGGLCVGLEKLHRLLQTSSPLNRAKMAADFFSHWIVTNESPDGYTLMFLRGDPGRMAVGDIVALHPEKAPEAQRHPIGLIRWVLSETPEHIEIGVQILAQDAIPTLLVTPDAPEEGIKALILPEYPPLRDAPHLVVPACRIAGQGDQELLLSRNGEAREAIRIQEACEQSPCLDIFVIAVAPPAPPEASS